ncbi:hypothetical protein ACMFMG_002748 [Clarireedia jacksonii]
MVCFIRPSESRPWSKAVAYLPEQNIKSKLSMRILNWWSSRREKSKNKGREESDPKKSKSSGPGSKKKERSSPTPQEQYHPVYDPNLERGGHTSHFKDTPSRRSHSSPSNRHIESSSSRNASVSARASSLGDQDAYYDPNPRPGDVEGERWWEESDEPRSSRSRSSDRPTNSGRSENHRSRSSHRTHNPSPGPPISSSSSVASQSDSENQRVDGSSFSRRKRGRGSDGRLGENRRRLPEDRRRLQDGDIWDGSRSASAEELSMNRVNVRPHRDGLRKTQAVREPSQAVLESDDDGRQYSQEALEQLEAEHKRKRKSKNREKFDPSRRKPVPQRVPQPVPQSRDVDSSTAGHSGRHSSTESTKPTGKDHTRQTR